MLTTQAQLMCSICHMSQANLPEWAHGVGALIEQEPGDFRCASTEAAILPPLPKLAPLESERLEHELQLFAWLCERAISDQRIEPLKNAADVVAAVERIDEWAADTDTVIYKLRHWPLGRLVMTVYDPTEGTRCY